MFSALQSRGVFQQKKNYTKDIVVFYVRLWLALAEQSAHAFGPALLHISIFSQHILSIFSARIVLFMLV